MNTFNMFKKDKQNSFIKNWAVKAEKKARKATSPTPNLLFAALIYGLTSFAKDNPKRKEKADLKNIGFDISSCSGDASLFELGCYLYFRLDLWLCKNNPRLRDELSTILAKNFVALFSEALRNIDIGELFNERIEKYGEMIRKGEDIKQYHFYLTQLILKTKNNIAPKSYDFDSEPLVLDFWGDLAIKIELITWEQTMLPAMIKSTENYCKLFGK